MIAKTLFLVLLGAAFVLATPVSELNIDSLVEQSEERSLKDTWTKFESKFNKAADEIKSAWDKIKKEEQKIANASLKSLKEKALSLLQKAKEYARQIVVEGKQAQSQLKEVFNSLDELYKQLKQNGDETVKEARDIVHDIVEAIKQKVAEIEKSKN